MLLAPPTQDVQLPLLWQLRQASLGGPATYRVASLKALQEKTVMVVEEVMSQNPYCAEVTATVGEVMNQLMELDIRHLPIVESGALVGIISDRDLRAIAPAGILEQGAAVNTTIGRIMSSDVVSVNPETELSEAVDLMIEHKIGAIPVVEADSSQLVGIVSYVDALRAARDAL